MPLASTILAAALGAANMPVTDDASLARLVDARIGGDASGVCAAVAFIDGPRTSRAFRCADPSATPRLGPDSAMEIGSISKAVLGTVVAELVLRGQGDLDDALADWLPAGTDVPMFDGQPIRLRHILTHTSGLPPLPSRMPMGDAADPYADLTAEHLLQSLQDVTLAHAPGTRFEYSNYGTMLLSLAVSHRSGRSLDAVLQEIVFEPLGMHGAWVGKPTAGAHVAQGHLPDGSETPAWRFDTDLAGVGGIRATLDDMVRFAQAQIGLNDSALDAAIDFSQRTLRDAEPQVAMQWMIESLPQHTLHWHNGGTYGFVSMLAFDRANQRAAVVLADTGLTARGGLDDLAMHLLDPELPLGKPEPVIVGADGSTGVPLSAEDRTALVAFAGRYRLLPGFDLEVRLGETGLQARATGQGAFALRGEGGDVFSANAFGIEIRFERDANGAVHALELQQGGEVLRGQRLP